MAEGLTQQFTATGIYTDGSNKDLTGQVTWASATPAVATISSTGLAQALATGTTQITASSNGVTSPADTLTVAASSYVVTNTNDSGPGSLRQAITNANANPGVDTITFAIPGSGVHTITPTSPLPALTDSVILDGYSQPGAQPNSLADGDNAVLTIEIDGSLAGPSADGLLVSADGTVIRGLAVHSFQGPEIEVQSADGVSVAGNFIGTDVTGSLAPSDGYAGVLVAGGSNNTIGGTAAADRNIVSGHSVENIGIYGSTATANLVQGNFAGTDALGTRSVFSGGIGVSLSTYTYGNTIGGNATGLATSSREATTASSSTTPRQGTWFGVTTSART